VDALQQLQKWYHSQCDGDWEHGYGVSIGTLDNPGWGVSINLKDTSLEGKPFTEIHRIEHETDWISCRIKDGNFEGHGGPFMLEEILKIFLAWAEESQPA
jgi:hypothetical protein